jgi:hypothetical protein
MISSLSLLDRRQKEQPFPRLAEVMGSTPTLSISYYEGITVLNYACFRQLSDKTPDVDKSGRKK